MKHWSILVIVDKLNLCISSVCVSLLHDHENIFLDEISIIRKIKHQINFVCKATITNIPAYRSSLKETKKPQMQVEKLMLNGYIRESMSSYALPMLLVPKTDETWRMYIDYHGTNNITLKYTHLIPRLDDMLNKLYGFCVFSKIDMKSEYNQIIIKEGDGWKTTFKIKIKCGLLYEWLAMPFELTNKPSTFMRLSNHILYNFISRFVMIYFDDILIYNNNLEKHVKHLRNVFDVLRKIIC